MNTHYAVISFSGDPAAEHPASELNGQAPRPELIACGPEEFCWEAITDWTPTHPLRVWEQGEALARDPVTVKARALAVLHRLGEEERNG